MNEPRWAHMSRYVIPCLCGRTVESHAPETRCEACGRLLVVEGREPAKKQPEKGEHHA